MQKTIYAFQLDRLAQMCCLHNRRIVSMIDGGLASQMWQFSLGYAVSKESGLPLHFEIDFYNKDGCDIRGNKNRNFLLLDTFPKIKDAYDGCFFERRDSLFCKLMSDRCIKRCYYEYTPEIFTPHSRYIQQYYSNVSYINKYQSELRELFSFSVQLSAEELALKEEIENMPLACSIHVRRGDFVNSVHHVCKDSYYIESLKVMSQIYPHSVFYVFSNDIGFCKNLFAGLSYDIRYLERRNESDPRVDLFLLSKFSHAIISNSGFSWFPAFLNSHLPNADVIAPDVWCKGKFEEKSRGAMILPRWRTLPAGI